MDATSAHDLFLLYVLSCCAGEYLCAEVFTAKGSYCWIVRCEFQRDQWRVRGPNGPNKPNGLNGLNGLI